MKLSKHGREHLGYHEAIGLGIGSYDFQQEDFTGAVVLTVEEAKEILQSSYDVLSWSMVGPTHRDNALSVQKLLKYRIEQAEAAK